MKRKALGLTLLELLVALAVLGLLLSLGLPPFKRLMAAIRLSGAAQHLASDLHLARFQAIARSTTARLLFRGTGYELQVGDQDPEPLRELPPGVQITRITRTPVFYPRGTAVPAGSITLSNASGSKRVVVSIVGRIRVE